METKSKKSPLDFIYKSNKYETASKRKMLLLDILTLLLLLLLLALLTSISAPLYNGNL